MNFVLVLSLEREREHFAPFISYIYIYISASDKTELNSLLNTVQVVKDGIPK